MKLFIIQSSPTSYHFVPHRSKCSPQHPVLTHPYKMTDKIIVLCILIFNFLWRRQENKRYFDYENW